MAAGSFDERQAMRATCLHIRGADCAPRRLGSLRGGEWRGSKCKQLPGLQRQQVKVYAGRHSQAENAPDAAPVLEFAVQVVATGSTGMLVQRQLMCGVESGQRGKFHLNVRDQVVQRAQFAVIRFRNIDVEFFVNGHEDIEPIHRVEVNLPAQRLIGA